MQHIKTLGDSIIVMVVVMLAYMVGQYFINHFHGPTHVGGGLWPAICGLLAASDRASQNPIERSVMRAAGFLNGSAVSMVYLFFFDFTVLGFGICIAIAAWICGTLKRPEMLSPAGIAIVVILVSTIGEGDIPKYIDAALRFVEAMLGVGVALLVYELAARIRNPLFTLGSDDSR